MEDQRQGTLVSCTRVSRTWSDVAIRRLWRHLASPLPLLELLAPLHPTTSGAGLSKTTTWVRTEALRINTSSYILKTFKPSEIATADWQRFEDYARRVVALTYDDIEDIKNSETNYIDSSAFIMVQCYRPHSAPLLPNLSSLSWTFRRSWDIHVAPSLIPLLSPTIATLQIHVAIEYSIHQPEEIATIWSTLTGRTPNVTSIHILMDSEETDPFDTHGSGWLASCRRLKSITLPRRWHSSSIVEALESLPELQAIRVDRSQDCYQWLSRTRISFLPRWLQHDFFPKLEFASFDASLPDLLQALQSSTKFGCLSGISYGTEVGPLTPLRDVLSLLAIQCTHLESVILDLTSHIDDDWIDTVHFEAYRPLLSCRGLSHVEIRHDRPIDVLESDI